MDLKYHNQELYEICKESMKKVIDFLKPHLKNKFLQSDIEFILFISKLNPQFENIPEYNKFINSLKNDVKFSSHLEQMVGTRTSQTRLDLTMIPQEMIKKLSKQYLRTRIFDYEYFDYLYAGFENFFYNDNVPISTILPLKNLKIDSDIDLGDRLKIRKTSYEDLEYIQDRYFFGVMGFHQNDFSQVIEHIIYAEKIIGDKKPKVENKINSITILENTVKALRLFKSGDFKHHSYITRTRSDVPISSGMYALNTPNFIIPSSNIYELKGHEIENFKVFWKQFNNSKFHQSKSIDIAIRRFNLAFDRTNLEDKIIDFLISYEALFFKNEKQELREKISRRVGILLENDFLKRQILAKEVKEIYDKRSSIVHGDSVLLTDDFIQRVEEILRLSIRGFLKKIETQNHDEIIDHLDFG